MIVAEPRHANKEQRVPVSEPSLPSWIVKRDGRRVPFAPDRISLSLFAASESIGRPDAFLARELTDSVLHFLPGDMTEATLTTAQVAELVVKVVRELGQPELAQAFAAATQRPKSGPGSAEPPAQLQVSVPLTAAPATLIAACLREYSLHTVFSRDIAAAHNAGLIVLTDLEAPQRLAGSLLRPLTMSTDSGTASLDPTLELLTTLEAARATVSRFVAVDSPEHTLLGTQLVEEADRCAARLLQGCAAVGLCPVVSLHCRSAPGWAEEHQGGPLFAQYSLAATSAPPPVKAEALLIAFIRRATPRCRPNI
jgi:hypothetical protein